MPDSGAHEVLQASMRRTAVQIVVVGSINRDLTVLTTKHPVPGETVMGAGHFVSQGGKGANQAVAASRLGESVGIVGRVGVDDAGQAAVAALRHEGVDVSGVSRDPDEPTGLALITVDERGENTIVVSPGANALLEPRHVVEQREMFSGASVTMAQLEIPIETVLAAAGAGEGLFMLNPAPAQTLPNALLDLTDVLVPNLFELATLSGVSTDELLEIQDVVDAARSIAVGSIVVTLGDKGAVAIEGTDVALVAAPTVTAVDTTGAGDSFCGALATGLAQGMTLVESVERSCRAAAFAVTKRGARDGMPLVADLNQI